MENKNAALESIIERITLKGGVIGSCAKLYANDKDLAKRFIIELAEQTYIDDFVGFFGEALVNDIQTFALNSS